jgi:hypothetical protein
LIVTARDGAVVALDTADGRTMWGLRRVADGGRAKVALSGRTLVVAGKELSAVDVGSGKDLWQAADPLRVSRDAISWGPPTVHSTHVYAACLGMPLRLDLQDGRYSDWAYNTLIECDPPSPLVVQDHGFWSVTVNPRKKLGGINVTDLTPGGTTTWVYPVIKNLDRYWITGDANRVFLLDGASLTALPVFRASAGLVRDLCGTRTGWDTARGSAPEIREDREDAAIGRIVQGQVELAEDRAEVLADRALADHQGRGDRGVGLALGHQREDLLLAGGQPGQRVASVPDQLPYDLGVDDGAALGHPAHGVDELLDVADAFLEEIADAGAFAGVEQILDVAALDVLAEHQDGQTGVVAAQFDGGAQSLVGEARRHPDVGHHDVGAVLGDGAGELVGGADGGDDPVAEAFQEPDQALAEQDTVLGEHDARHQFLLPR